MTATALILVDLQNAFCDPQGSFCKRFGRLHNLAAARAACARLHRAAHARGILTIFTALQFSADYSDAGLLVRHRAPAIAQLRAYARNSWDAALALTPLPGDILLPKTRYDPFIDTPLERTLRRRGISHLLLAGVLTNVCLEACARSAFDRDFLVTIARDATTALTPAEKSASLRTLRRHYASLTTSRAPDPFAPPQPAA